MSVEVIGALTAGIVSVLTAMGILLSRLKEIHVLVNSQMSNALSEIAELKRTVANLTGTKIDEARATIAEDVVNKRDL